MTQLPLVSVLVAVRDAADGLAASLDAALAQDYEGLTKPLAKRWTGTPGFRRFAAFYRCPRQR